jgi:hypothetical protein
LYPRRLSSLHSASCSGLKMCGNGILSTAIQKVSLRNCEVTRDKFDVTGRVRNTRTCTRSQTYKLNTVGFINFLSQNCENYGEFNLDVTLAVSVFAVKRTSNLTEHRPTVFCGGVRNCQL